MYAIFKYVVGVSAVISVITLGVIFFDSAAIVNNSAPLTPSWKIDRFKVDPDLPAVAQGTLSPIYPATPGKELLGKPVFIAGRVSQKHQQPGIRKPTEKSVQQALRTNILPRQIYAASEPDRYSRQSLSYAFEPQSQPRTSINFGHDIY